MQKLRLIFISIVLSLAGVQGLASREYPVLPMDPAVTSGRLPDGIRYLIVPDSGFRGVADVVLLQRVCQTPEMTCFRDVPLYRGEAELDSLLSRIFALIADSIEEDSARYGTDNQTIIICGDVKVERAVAIMQRLCERVPASSSTEVAAPYVWRGPYVPVWEVTHNPDGTAVLRFTSVLRRMDKDMMGTVVPLVSMRMDRVLEVVLRKSLESSFERLSIPYAFLSFTPQRSWNCYGDEKYTLSVKLRSEDAERAERAVKSICSSLAGGNMNRMNFAVVRDEVMSSAYMDANHPLTNMEQTERCVASELYGTSLHSPMEGYRFFASRDVPDSIHIRGVNRRAAEIFAHTPQVETDFGVRVVTVNKSDTLSFPSPLKRRMKLKSEREDHISGGTIWTFDNGLNVVYKRMDTHGLLYYSMVFRCGASFIKDAPSGEAAFYEDMFRCSDVGTLSGRDFQRLQEACGVTMDCKVGLYETSLSGQTGMASLEMLLKQLVHVTAERHPSAKAGRYAAECARLSLRPQDMVREMLYDKIHPDYPYTPFRVEYGLTPTLQENAERLFERAFSHCEESTLILVGDRDPSEALKVLRRYAGSFRTASGTSVKTSVPFSTIAGSVNVEGPGPRALSVELSAPLIYTADNYFAAMVLQEAVKELLSGYAAEVSLNLNPRPIEHLEMRISAPGDVFESELMLALDYLASGDDDVYAALGDWRTMVLNRIEYLKKSPQYWIDAVRIRYIDAKDVVGRSREKISSVSKERLVSMASALCKGGRVIYQTCPEK